MFDFRSSDNACIQLHHGMQVLLEGQRRTGMFDHRRWTFDAIRSVFDDTDFVIEKMWRTGSVDGGNTFYKKDYRHILSTLPQGEESVAE